MSNKLPAELRSPSAKKECRLLGVLKSAFKFVNWCVILFGWVEKLWQKSEAFRSLVTDLFS
ncbi:hypothetical protein CHR62_13360 [Pusillimonas sp. NJUB218]|nr:hypothetical protein CHR62_13360 [Pusillimonas sp. NJUB218]